jgi:hypothetical protein
MTKLSDVPHDKVIGLQVISCSTGAKGIVTEAYRDTRYIEDDIDGYFVHIEWDNGNISWQRHYMLDRVEVIEQ